MTHFIPLDSSTNIDDDEVHDDDARLPRPFADDDNDPDDDDLHDETLSRATDAGEVLWDRFLRGGIFLFWVIVETFLD